MIVAPLLAHIERIDGELAVVFYPYVGCDISEAICLAKFGTDMDSAMRYKMQFADSLRAFEIWIKRD